MGIVTTKVEVNVAGAPGLAHRRSTVWFSHAWLNVFRMEGNAAMFPNQISTRGAHISVLFPVMLAIDAFERREASYVFEGTQVGSMSELANRPAAEEGPCTHGIDRAAIAFAIEGDRCRIAVEGRLKRIAQTLPHWTVPPLRSSFTMRLDLAVADGLELFPALEPGPKERLAKAIEAILAG